MAEESADGGVIRVGDITPRHGIPGHPGVEGYRFVRPGSGSRWLHVSLNIIEQGGGIDNHFHEGIVADHAYFVMEGTVRARIGDEYHEVGPLSLLMFPCEKVHGFTVTSPEGAKILRLGAAAEGPTAGGSVYI